MKDRWNDFNRMSGRLFEGMLIRAFDAALTQDEQPMLLDHPMVDSEMRKIVSGSPALQVLEELSHSLDGGDRVASFAERYGISEDKVRGIGLGLEIAAVAFTGYIQGIDELAERERLANESTTL